MNWFFAIAPFAAVILLIFGWSIPKLVRAFRQSVLWTEETVEVTKAIRDELPFFSYRLGGKDLTSDRIPDDVADGESVTFIFPPGAPEKARMEAMKEDWTFNLILFLVGCLATAMLTWMFVESAADKKTEARTDLRTTGLKITVPASNAFFEKTDEDQEEYTLNVVCVDPRDGSALRLQGRTYLYDPTEQLAAIENFDVYVDSTDRDRYLLDISFTAPITTVGDRPPLEEETASRGWVCLIFGLVLFGGCLFWLTHQYQLVKSGDRAVAKVLNFVSKRTKRGYAYYPFVQFSTMAGMRIRTTLPEGSNPPAYEVGDNVVIFYQHEQPGDVTTLNLAFIIFPSVMMFIGAALMMAGVYFFMN